MSKRWLNLFFKFSGVLFRAKQKMVSSQKIIVALPYAIVVIFLELGFAIISLPMYLIVSPKKVQERGFVFPVSEEKERGDVIRVYTTRRRISLTTGLGAGTFVVFKILLLIFTSFYLLGGQALLAATTDWTFNTAGNYTYDSGKVEVTGGAAQLLDLGGTSSGNTLNSGFDSDSSSWTYNDWGQTGGEVDVAGTWQTSGGNPGGFVSINFPLGKADELGGYYEQSFTTTVDNPTIVTVDYDWLVSAYAATPNTFKLYVFVDSASGAPTIGQEVWSSSEITSTQSWTSASTIDASASVGVAGTYYLKIAVWLETPNTNMGPFTIGYDDAIVSWSKSSSSYATDNPTIEPTTSLQPASIVTWDSMTETATKNGGEIYYQLSDDDGSAWQYFNGSIWTTAGASNYNTATVVDTNISSFSASAGKIMWKAFLEGDGSQQVILSNLQIGYTENDLPDIANISPVQNTTSGLVNIDYDIVDIDNDPASLVTYEYSLTGAFAGEEVVMTASTTDANHDGLVSLSSSAIGVTHTFAWDAMADVGNIYDATTYVRLRANDGIGNGLYASSTAFTVDYVVPVISGVSVSQVASSTDVTITYDLSDDTSTDLLVELDISEDGGSTWTVTDTSVTGAVGSAQSTGVGQTITWSAGTDFDEQSQVDMQVRVRAKDKYQNQGTNATSANFSLDTVNPVTNIISDLQAQPNAGDTTVLIGGSFTEGNPAENNFYVAINGGAYGSATSGDYDTASPSNQATAVGVTLDGNDYINLVKITHTDDFGQTVDNENASPTVAYQYVKPYTPQAPVLSSPVTTQLDLTINSHVSESAGLEYLIQETSGGDYLQANGTLGASAVWQTDSAWGTVTVTGLTSPVANYIFKSKSRNTSDPLDATTSQSEWSATSQITNTAPSISYDSTTQETDGTQYVTIDYTGTDGQGDINTIDTYDYSQDNSTWFTMTEKSGVGSDGLTNLIFLSGGSTHDFMWDSGTDLSGVEDSTVYVRLRSGDTLASSTLAVSSAFEVDNTNPAISNVSVSQDASARTVTISYDVTDANNSTIEIDISEDGGSTWSVTDTSVTGNVGAGVTPGTSKSITWDAGTDFDSQYQTDIKVRVRALDTFGNQGSNSESANFTIDTKDPSVTSVSGSQDTGALTFTFNYDVSEDTGNVTVGLEVSSDGGSTWVVPITSASGDIGAGIVAGTGKVITWNGSTDYSGNEENDMQARITATDQFTNAGVTASPNFSLDTLAPIITSLSATQSGAVTITYDLADQNWSTIEIDISEDGGSTWTVTDTSVTGDIGSSIVEGAGKAITWDAGVDFNNEEQADMRVRVRGLDTYSNQSGYTESANFSLDTVDPLVNVTSDLQAQPNAGDTTVLIGGSFIENNPNLNTFYVALNGGVYSSGTAGDTNTASPSNQATAADVTLDGNDYISGTKITHSDDFGQSGDNENTSPSTSFKYVKPYTPAAATVYNPTVGTVDVLINLNVSETSGLEYAIYESTQDKWVQSNGTLGASTVWQIRGTGSGEWGNSTGDTGRVTASGLVNDSYTYIFQIKSRNTSDPVDASSSESALSAGVSSTNQSPTISISTTAQTTDGTQYVTINYTGTDLEGESSNIITAEYSTDNSSWSTMTEKAGVGSDGTTSLSFTSGGTAHDFMWDVGTDLASVEDSTVYIRLQASDGTSSGNIETSSAFTIDTKNPVISSPTATQTLGTNSVVFGYTLTDLSSGTVEIDISEDSGSSWTVTDTSVTGDVGASVVAGAGKSITWDPGSDFNNQDQSDMRVRIRALDAYGNQGGYTSSFDFALDTDNPVISNVSASQDSGESTVTITYDIADTNNSTIEIDISEDGGSTWNVTDTSVTGNIGAGVTPGTSKSITWDAGTDFSGEDQLDIRVRVNAYDVYANNSNVLESSNFSLDTLGPVIANVSASQTSGTDNVVITYDLTDNSSVTVEIDISEDGGSTWNVTDTSVTGDIGASVSQGTGKSITWDAGSDFGSEDQIDLRVRIRGLDVFTNSSGDIESANFSLDTLAPSVNTTADLASQSNAGDTTVTISGSFTESNPNINTFSVAINGGAYGSGTAGDTNTASPSNQATGVGVTLDGNDYISAVKIAHSDDFGHSSDNENTSVTLKYVKPYTPATVTVDNPQNTSIDITINKHASEVTGLEYAIYENTTDQYVQANGALGASAVWQVLGTSVGQWGENSAVSGKVAITGLSSPVAQYGLQVKSRNTSDPADAASSESSFSSSAGISNTSPTIIIDTVAQQTGGVNYVDIDYTGTDTQNDTVSLVVYEYSTDNSSWSIMTEKSGVGSNGTSSLVFTSSGASFTFAWDAGTDLSEVEDSTVYVRIQASDTLATGNLEASSAFAIDNSGPIISNLSISQTASTDNIVIEYDLTDNTGSGNLVEIDISEDGGATWNVTDTSVTGSVGSGITAGVDRTITWDAGTDFASEEQSDMKVRVRATDTYGNVGSYTSSDNFTVDTGNPVTSDVSASQDSGSSTVTISYTLTDGSAGGHNVEIGISEDSGSTWNVATTTASGHIGAGQSTGTKTISWDAGTDFDNEDQSDLRVRVRVTDFYGHVGSYVSSADFALDTADPVISNISSTQTAGTSDVVFDYDLSDTNTSNLTVEIDISSDGGSTWTVTDTSSTGAVGSSISSGVSKSIDWPAGTDFGNQEESDMRLRVRATDIYGNISDYFSSVDFSLDTAGPLGLLSFSEFSSTETTVTLNWSSGVTDASFDHYEIWYGTNSGDVDNRTGTATEWDNSDDANLVTVSTISTVITGLIDNTYYAKIFAIDTFANETTLNNISFIIGVEEEEPEPEPEPVVGGGGGIAIALQDIVPPGKPVIATLESPTNNTTVSVSGLAEPRSLIDLYDNGQLVTRFSSTADNTGVFAQNIIFEEGVHNLTVRASDFFGNASVLSEPFILVIDQTAPEAPIILTPGDTEDISTATPELIGISDPFATVTILIDGAFSFTISVNGEGAWNFIVPSDFSLSAGDHTFVVNATDEAGNVGPSTTLSLTRGEIAVVVLGTPPIVSGEIIPSIPLPPEAEIVEIVEAIELPGVPVPEVTQTVAEVVNNIIQFSGTALPNKDIVIYIHSDQALIYRTRSDENGLWVINHSQDLIELSPGEHSIFAVTVDTDAKVKSRPSEVRLFDVKKSLLSTLFNLLNIQTTIITLVSLSLVAMWLYNIKKKTVAPVIA